MLHWEERISERKRPKKGLCKILSQARELKLVTLTLLQVNRLLALNESKMVADGGGNGGYSDTEGRLSIAEVPEQISRIFFGDPNPR